MEKEQEQEIYVNSEILAFEIAGVMSKNNDRYIDESVKSRVKDDELIDEVYRATIHLLEDKYGILFDVDKKVDI